MFSPSLQVFWQLFISELGEVKHVLKDKLIDNLLYMGCFILLFGYIIPLPDQGMQYGPFIAASMIASLSFWDVALGGYGFLMDLEGNKVISYDLIMPIPTNWVFFKKILVSAVKACIVGCYAIPLGKLLLWNQFSLTAIDPIRLIVAFITCNIFFGAFGLWFISMIPSVAKIESWFARLIMPMWFFGATQFSWQSLHHISPTVAYIDLLNPIVYVMEGMRAAVLGQGSFLPFWNCMAVLWALTFILGAWGISILKKRLDCVA